LKDVTDDTFVGYQKPAGNAMNCLWPIRLQCPSSGQKEIRREASGFFQRTSSAAEYSVT